MPIPRWNSVPARKELELQPRSPASKGGPIKQVWVNATHSAASWYFPLPCKKYIQSHFGKFPPQFCPDSLVSHLSEWHHHSGVHARHTHVFSLLHSHCHCPRSTLWPSPTCLMPKVSNLSSSFYIYPNNHSISSALLGVFPKFSPPFLLIPFHFIVILVLVKPAPSFHNTNSIRL